MNFALVARKVKYCFKFTIFYYDGPAKLLDINFVKRFFNGLKKTDY